MGSNEEHTGPVPDGKIIEVTERAYGNGSIHLKGICSLDVTVADIKATQYDPEIGGDGAWVDEGKWRCIRYTRE